MLFSIKSSFLSSSKHLLNGLSYEMVYKLKNDLNEVFSSSLNTSESSASMPSNICSICSQYVSTKQHGLLCDRCDDWFHRTCCHNTISAMDLATYKRVLRIPGGFMWHCPGCKAEIRRAPPPSPILRNVSFIMF